MNPEITMFLAVENPTHEDIEYAQELMTRFKHPDYLRKKLKSNMKLRFKDQNVYPIGE